MHKLIVLVFVLFAGFFANANNADSLALLTINGNPISKDEFVRIYTKNNQDPSFDKASLDEYMELFINFKLKVIEAESRGMDTAKKFVQELKGYRYQLEKPYLTSPETDDELIKEAYYRMGFTTKARHILIRCSHSDLPKDTLKAYNEIKRIHALATKRGADFARLAKQYSEDEHSGKNGGELGWFSAFSMVYEFESAAYNTEVGAVSSIARTKFGYHIIKVDDRIESPGQVKVAHIMRATPKGSTQKKIMEEKGIINEIYDSIMAGADFAEMALKHSDDRGTSRRGGELPMFGHGRMIPEFEKVAFELENIGDVSEPVQTQYGWHVIKLLEVKKLGSLEEMTPVIKNKISKDIRASKGKRKLIASLKKEYNFAENPKNIEIFYDIVDSSIYKGEWDITKADGLDKVLFSFADTVVFTQSDFAKRLSSKQKRTNEHFIVLVNKEYRNFIDKQIIDYERTRLEEKYPDFKHLLQEYHDGILLFNLSDELVWSKAVKDTSGLEAYHGEHKNEYLWGDRVEATIYTFSDSNYIAAISKMAAKVGKKNADYLAALNKYKDKVLAKDSAFTLSATKAKYSKGDNALIDELGWEPGIKKVVNNDNGLQLVYVNRKVDPEPKLLNEARGLITADYQTYLEEKWIEELRTKYKVEVNQQVFDNMIE